MGGVGSTGGIGNVQPNGVDRILTSYTTSSILMQQRRAQSHCLRLRRHKLQRKQVYVCNGKNSTLTGDHTHMQTHFCDLDMETSQPLWNMV